jgi:hypothetical protein
MTEDAQCQKEIRLTSLLATCDKGKVTSQAISKRQLPWGEVKSDETRYETFYGE